MLTKMSGVGRGGAAMCRGRGCVLLQRVEGGGGGLGGGEEGRRFGGVRGEGWNE